MQNETDPNLLQLLRTVLSEAESAKLMSQVAIPASVSVARGETVERGVLAMALNLLLFHDLLQRVPHGRAYVEEVVASGQRVVFDHGALRTVALDAMGSLPRGEAAITRVLAPLGYGLRDVYPLPRLSMTGRSYAHLDWPEDLPQFFVSEFHPERFSQEFQAAVARVTAHSKDPLSDDDRALLEQLEGRKTLPFLDAARLLPSLVRCFDRHHPPPSWRDYEILLAESAEMAWIATEGSAFNHATDRVESLEALVARQRALGRPLKDAIEVSRSGRVLQTAFKAASVERTFIDENGQPFRRSVPGSFYEFIQRERTRDPVSGKARLDLAFDSSNAQGIFEMTSARAGA